MNRVDKELRQLLELFPLVQFSMESLAAARTMMTQMAALAGSVVRDDVILQERTVAATSSAPAVRMLVCTPRNCEPNHPAILFIHGGGYVAGCPEQDLQRMQSFALACQGTVLSVDYRLAPESPYPGPLDDCYAALKWLHSNALELGVDATRIAVAGESAGGGLAAALALLARDRMEVRLAFQLLIYPMLDDRTGSTAQRNAHTGQHIWTAESNNFGWQCLLGHAPGGEEVSAYAAPARALDVSGLPPAFIAVGSLDLFVDENLAYAHRLLRSGVPIELHIYPGAYHGFPMATEAALSKAFEADCIAALNRALAIT